MPDFLDVLAKDALKTISEGYYNSPTRAQAPTISLKEAVLKCRRAPIISEIKFASPSRGASKKHTSATEVATDMEAGGAIAISVLTEPKHFEGSLDTMPGVRTQVKVPLLMKDIVLSRVQIEAASRMGANAILLIEALFKRGYCEDNLQEMIGYAHSKSLEVLLEAHDEEDFSSALHTEADMIGINNRDLRTLKVDLATTKRILERNSTGGRVIVSESGIHTPADVRFLRRCGADAFLVGSSIMESEDIRKKVEELVTAL